MTLSWDCWEYQTQLWVQTFVCSVAETLSSSCDECSGSILVIPARRRKQAWSQYSILLSFETTIYWFWYFVERTSIIYQYQAPVTACIRYNPVQEARGGENLTGINTHLLRWYRFLWWFGESGRWPKWSQGCIVYRRKVVLSYKWH